jgi:hypothetical protein
MSEEFTLGRQRKKGKRKSKRDQTGAVAFTNIDVGQTSRGRKQITVPLYENNEPQRDNTRTPANEHVDPPDSHEFHNDLEDVPVPSDGESARPLPHRPKKVKIVISSGK